MRKITTHMATAILGFAISTLLSGYPADAARDATVDFSASQASTHVAMLEAQIDALQHEKADVERAVMAPVPPDYREAVARAADANRLSIALLAAVGTQETDWDCTRVGDSGELGCLQVLPETARDVAERNGLSMADMAGAGGIAIGARYLRECIGAEGGELWRGLALYNGGGDWRRKPDAIAYAAQVLGKMDALTEVSSK